MRNLRDSHVRCQTCETSSKRLAQKRITTTTGRAPLARTSSNPRHFSRAEGESAAPPRTRNPGFHSSRAGSRSTLSACIPALLPWQLGNPPGNPSDTTFGYSPLRITRHGIVGPRDVWRHPRGQGRRGGEHCRRAQGQGGGRLLLRALVRTVECFLFCSPRFWSKKISVNFLLLSL